MIAIWGEGKRNTKGGQCKVMTISRPLPPPFINRSLQRKEYYDNVMKLRNLFVYFLSKKWFSFTTILGVIQ